MVTPRRLLAIGLLSAVTLSCDSPSTVCLGGPPTCDGELRPTSVAIAPEAVTLTHIGQTLQLSATVLDQLGGVIDTLEVEWSSATTGVADVSDTGLLTASGNGTTQVTATVGAISGVVAATVAQTPATIDISPDPIQIPGPGAGAVITTTVWDAGGTEILSPVFDWSSDDDGVATVIDEGVVTGEAQGTTTLRVVANHGGQSADGEVDVSVSAPTPGTVEGAVIDAETSLVLSGATVDLSGPSGPLASTTTDGSGAYSFADLAGGTYTITVTDGGYDAASAVDVEVEDGTGDVVRVDFGLTPTGSSIRFGSLSGKVTFGGAPLEDATVSISGGEQTNGIFQSTLTDEHGNYSLVGMNMDDTDGAPITEFTVLTTRGFSAVSLDLSLAQNQTIPNVDLELQPTSSLDIYFQDDFETASSAWTTSGFWNRSMLTGLTNAAYPTYVELAPSDLSNGALPTPTDGLYAFWYGEPATGNFLGTQSSSDSPGSGGTSDSANDGRLTSPTFTIPSGAATATLRFRTWFEIESVNPNDSGFDIMNVSVLTSGASSPTVVARLNPFIDPTLPNRNAIPFTSGGFNKVPVWRTEFFDLSDYIGQTIQLVFEFDTVDALYNGFRGWIIDEVSVSDLEVAAPAPASPSSLPTAPAARAR